MFNYNTRIPSVQGTQNIQTVPQSAGAQQQNIFTYGGRLAASGGAGLPVINPDQGFPTYEYYKTYQLPTQYVTNAFGLLSYFKSCGFSVGYGYSSSISLLNASYVDITTNAAKDQAIVYYLNSSALVAPLVGAQITGTFTDTTETITGTFVSAEVGSFTISSTTYDSKIILESSDFATIAAGNNITIDFNDPILVPDPLTTDPFIMNLYQAAQSALIPINVNSTLSTPNVYFAILPNSADSGFFGPTSDPITLTAPTAASGSTITFAVPSNNIGLLPLSALGNTTITQATSNATGVLVSAVENGGSMIVTLSNVSGTFNTTDICTLALDPTQTIFSFAQATFIKKNASLRYLPLIYAVNSATDITTTYAAIFDFVAAMNLPQTSQNGQGVCQVIIGNTSYTANLVAADLPTNVNSFQIIPVWYNYNNLQIGDLPYSIGQLTSSTCMVLGNNVAPNNPQGGVVLNSTPVLKDSARHISAIIGGVADQVMQLGWNVVAVNNNDQAYIINPITGQTTLPGTSVADKEFYPTYVWDTVNQLRLGVIYIVQAIGLGQVRQTPKVLSVIRSNIVSFMLDMQAQGQLKSVLANSKYMIIKEDATNPLGIYIEIPSQVIPGLENVYYTIDLFSYTINLQNAA